MEGGWRAKGGVGWEVGRWAVWGVGDAGGAPEAGRIKSGRRSRSLSQMDEAHELTAESEGARAGDGSAHRGMHRGIQCHSMPR